MECLECGSSFSPDPRRPQNARRQKFCSKRHAQQYRRKKRFPATRLALPTGTVGALHELLASADLLRRGYEVFRALSQAASCDLAILKDGHLFRVEVTTGYRRVDGKILHPPKKNPYDILAVVVESPVEIVYIGLE